MSLINPIKVKRVNLAYSQNSPIEWSDNLQLSLNLYTDLTVLDPKLPDYHLIITDKDDKTVLDAKELFSETILLHNESISLLPLGRFNKIIITDTDEGLNLVASEPNIVLQQWTPNCETTRDNLLGVLFNSGELLILGRKNVQLLSYVIRINVFNILVEKYNIQCDLENMFVTAEEYKKLKIKYFAFSKYHGSLALTIVDHNDSLLLFTIDEKTFATTLLFEKKLDIRVLKIVWSIDYEYLIVIGLDSSITSYLVKDNFEKLSVIHPPTRFKTFCNKFVKSDDKSYLISAFTGKIVVSEIGGANYEFKLDTYAACNSIVSGITNGVLTLLLSFDTGKFKTVKFDITSKDFTQVPLDKSIIAFVNKSLYAYQFQNDNDSSKGTPEPIMKLFGINSLPNGTLAIFYKVTSANVIEYRSMAFLDVNIRFLKLSEPIGNEYQVHNRTSIAKFIENCIGDFHNFPTISNDLRLLRKDRVNKFIENFKTFKEQYLLSNFDFGSDLHPLSDFETTLKKNFIENSVVIQAQYLYILATFIESGLTPISSEKPTEVDVMVKEIQDYKKSIENSIIIYLRKLILGFYNGKTVTDEYGKFSLITMLKQLRRLNDVTEFNISESAAVTTKTRYYSETFQVSVNDIDDDNNLHIVSTLGHGWTQCQLTNIPLLQMNNKTDERAQFRYAIRDEEFGELVNTLLDTIDFCYITGNKIYPLK